MEAQQHHNDMTADDNALLTVLHYFDYFHFPLTLPEIGKYCRIVMDSGRLAAAAGRLQQAGTIACMDAYYGIRNIAAGVSERQAGELRYAALQQRILRSAGIVKQFPFVQFVGLSGSLSKGYAPAHADIDLFLVTATGRLWICRTLLHLYKKLSFLGGNQHWYCMNYFIDETAVYLEEQNYYTAIELTTMKPLYDPSGLYERMITLNLGWIRQQLPNYVQQPDPAWTSPAKPGISSLLAWFCGSSWLNWQLMRLTDAKWRRKWLRKQYPAGDYELAFKTRINISKNHYHNYQKKLLRHLEQLNGNAS